MSLLSTAIIMSTRNAIVKFIHQHTSRAVESDTKFTIGKSWVLLTKEANNTSLEFRTYEPVICLIVQGKKELISSREVISASAGQSILISHDIHVQARIKVIQKGAPYTAVIIPIDIQKLREIVIQISYEVRLEKKQSAISVATTSSELEDAVLRYLKLLNNPQDIDILATSLLKEIYFRILTSEGGSMLRELLIVDSHADRIQKAVTYIKSNYRSNILIDDLIKHVGMSGSSFHMHFKRITGNTPKKMQSDLRLMEVRERLRVTRETISNLAFDVGYNSLAQLSKEYKKKFGTSPLQDRT